MQFDQFLEKLPDNYSALDSEQIEKAYQMAEQAHQGQKLPSGLPYITHCLAVASILAELSVPPELLIAGLLHDVVEDTPVSLEDIRKAFNDEVASQIGRAHV